MPSNSRRSASRNTSSPAASWPADHRDQIVGATLAGMVLVLLGYASGIGGGGGVAQATGGPPQARWWWRQARRRTDRRRTSFRPPEAQASRAITGTASAAGPARVRTRGSAWPSPSAESRTPDIVGGSPSASPSDSPSSSPSGAPSSTASCSLLDCVTSVLTGTTGGFDGLLARAREGSADFRSDWFDRSAGTLPVRPGAFRVTAPVGSLTGRWPVRSPEGCSAAAPPLTPSASAP